MKRKFISDSFYHMLKLQTNRKLRFYWIFLPILLRETRIGDVIHILGHLNFSKYVSGLCHNLIYEIEIFHCINRKTWVIFLLHVLNLLSEISLFRKLIYDIAPGGFLAHLSQTLEWAVVIAHRPSSVRPSSVVRPSVWRKLSHFRLLLWHRWTEFNETWQEARSQRPLPSLCFLGRSEKQDGRPGLWLAETFSTSPLKPLNGIQQNLTGSKISTPSTKFVFFGPIGKTRWPPWPLIGWDIFDFSSEMAERNSMKLDRKQDLNALY